MVKYLVFLHVYQTLISTVEPHSSELQNSGKFRISKQFSNDQIFTFSQLNVQNSVERRNNGRILGDQTFRYYGAGYYCN